MNTPAAPGVVSSRFAVATLWGSILSRSQDRDSNEGIRDRFIGLGGWPGSNRKENIGAVAIELTSDDLGEIEGAAARITVHGARYPEELERRTGR